MGKSENLMKTQDGSQSSVTPLESQKQLKDEQVMDAIDESAELNLGGDEYYLSETQRIKGSQINYVGRTVFKTIETLKKQSTLQNEYSEKEHQDKTEYSSPAHATRLPLASQDTLSTQYGFSNKHNFQLPLHQLNNSQNTNVGGTTPQYSTTPGGGCQTTRDKNNNTSVISARSKKGSMSQKVKMLNSGEIESFRFKCSQFKTTSNEKRKSIFERERLSDVIKCPKNDCKLQLKKIKNTGKTPQYFNCNACKKTVQRTSEKIVICNCKDPYSSLNKNFTIMDICAECYKRKKELDKRLNEEMKQLIQNSKNKCKQSLSIMNKNCKKKCRISPFQFFLRVFSIFFITAISVALTFLFADNLYVTGFLGLIGFIILLSYLCYYLPERQKIICRDEDKRYYNLVREINSKEWCEDCLSTILQNNLEIHQSYIQYHYQQP